MLPVNNDDGTNLNINENGKGFEQQAMLLLRTIVNISNSTTETNLTKLNRSKGDFNN